MLNLTETERKNMRDLWDRPGTEGVQNGVRRARQLCRLRWTPVEKMPSGLIRTTSEGKRYIDTFLSAWYPRTGVPYSSVRLHETYVGNNVSIETFMTALKNPDSLLYTAPQHGLGRSMFSYYGTVCSTFLSYATGMPVRTNCSLLLKDPRFKSVDPNDPRGFLIGDILLSKDHTALVTGIRREEDGTPKEILVAESQSPFCTETSFSLREFEGSWIGHGYGLYRYNGWERVSYKPSPYVPLPGDPDLPAPREMYMLLADRGDKANYTLGEPVCFHVFDQNVWEVFVRCGDDAPLTLPVQGGRAAFHPSRPGIYRAAAAGTDDEVSFAVTSGKLEPLHTPSVPDGEAVFRLSCPKEDEPLGYLLQNPKFSLKGRGEFTETEKQERRFTVSFPGPGEYTVACLVKNRFGVYRTELYQISVR